MQLPWPNSECEPTPPPENVTDSSDTAGQEPEELSPTTGRHRAEESNEVPLSPEQKEDLARRQAVWRQIDTAWSEGDVQTLIDISGSDQYDILMRKAAETRLDMLREAVRHTEEIPQKPPRYVGRVAIGDIKSRHSAFTVARFLLPKVEKNHP